MVIIVLFKIAGPPKDGNILNIPHHCFIASAFGYPGNVQWEPLDEKTPVGNEGKYNF